MKEYKIVLLDLDETVFDFTKAEEESLKRAFDMAGIFHNEESRRVYKEINFRLWGMYEKGLITSERLRVKRFEDYLEYFNITGNPEYLNKLYVEGLAECAYMLEGAEDFVKYLHGKYKICVVTNGIKENQYSRVSKSPLKHLIDAMVVSEEAGEPKPGRRIFEMAMARSEENDVSRVVIIGDKLESDILGGINFGCDSIWYNPMRKENLTDIKPTFEVHSYEEIKKIL